MSVKRVLVVDDEESILKVVDYALSQAGYEVHTASAAEEGMRLVHRVVPDLVCLDLVMPGRTGLSLYRELREDPSLAGVTIVVVSGVVPRDAAAKLGLGEELPPPDAFVEKPVDLELLIRTADRLCPARERNP